MTSAQIFMRSYINSLESLYQRSPLLSLFRTISKDTLLLTWRDSRHLMTYAIQWYVILLRKDSIYSNARQVPILLCIKIRNNGWNARLRRTYLDLLSALLSWFDNIVSWRYYQTVRISMPIKEGASLYSTRSDKLWAQIWAIHIWMVNMSGHHAPCQWY